MRIKITKESLIYDISNYAYIVASMYEDMAKPCPYVRITDICEAGNRDRVARVLGLAYARIMDILSPVTDIPAPRMEHDFSKEIHDYIFSFCSKMTVNSLTPQRKLKIKETVREFMVCMVIADWLGTILPEAADIWKERMEECESALAASVASLTSPLRRIIPPM